MKQALIVGIFLFVSSVTFAQKYAIVDTKYILENMPDYHDAQRELDQVSQQWQTEIEKRHETIDKLKKALAAERVLLTDQMIETREEEITEKEISARELQRKRFGVNGDLFKRRQELIQPIQDEIYGAIAEVADRSGYMAIFDKGTNSNILYVSSKYDLSDRILRRLGIRPGEASGGDDSGKSDDRGSGNSPEENKRSGVEQRGNPSSPARGGSASPSKRPSTMPAKGGR